MKYVFQHPDFALGNFINCIPAIRYLFEKGGGRIPVYFSTEYVRQCFLDCQFIEILDTKPDGEPIFGSNFTNNANDKPDYQYIFEQVTGLPWSPDFHTYIDTPTHPGIKELGKYAVVINGSGSDDKNYVVLKNPGRQRYEDLFKIAEVYFKWKRNLVATGSHEDLIRSPWLKEMADIGFMGDIRNSLAIIYGAEFIVANDCGLAHAAGAMQKNLIVLWKDTPRERCKNAGPNTVYLYEDGSTYAGT